MKSDKRKEQVKENIESNFNEGSSKKSNRSSRRRSNGKRKSYDTSKGEYNKTSATNDVSWRISDMKLRNDAANISWSYQTGDAIPLRGNGVGVPDSAFTLPGIIARCEMLTPGTLEAGTSNPAKVAANTLLTVMRSKTRVRNTYDAPDIAIKISAMAEIYAGIAFAKRLYSTNLMYSYMNKYLPDALFSAQCIDPTPLKNDSYAFLSRLNRIISIVNTVYIPDRMPYFKMLTQRYGNYYTEGPSIKDQIYVATPGVLKVEVTEASTDYAGALAPSFITPHDPAKALTGIQTAAAYGAKNATTDELLNCLEYMINVIINDSDTPDITGDMQNAFGEGNRYVIPMLDAESVSVPIYDEEFLEMFMNSKTYQYSALWYSTYDWANAANNGHRGWVIQQPTSNNLGLSFSFDTDGKRWASLDSMLLSVHKDPTIDKTVMITRNVDMLYFSEYKVLEDTRYLAMVRAVGVIGLMYRVASYNSNGELEVTSMVTDMGDTTVSNFMSAIKADAFHYRPILLFGNNLSGISCINGELDIVATISWRDLYEINRLDMLTMLGAFDTVG